MHTVSPDQAARDERVRLLSARIIDGSETAFSSLYGLIFDPLFRTILVRTQGDEELAKEIMQRVLLRLVRHPRPFPNERALWGWLRQVAWTAHIDLLRKTRRELTTIPIEPLEDHIPALEDENASLMTALEKGIMKLDATEREILQLAYFEGVGHRELATRLLSTPKAIESKLARIRGKLKQLLIHILQEHALF